MSNVTYPNGQTLVSSALTAQQMNQLFQTLTCGMLSINPPDLSQVRVDWQTEGQPFTVNPAQDGCFLSCVTTDEAYARVRDQLLSQNGATVQENWTYTRPWRVGWVLYGPNSMDRARAIWSGTFMDYFSDQLSLSGLYLLNDPAVPRRLPEQFNAQWWDRSDFSIDLYEQVTETIQDSVATSVEVKVYDNSGQVADFTVQEQ